MAERTSPQAANSEASQVLSTFQDKRPMKMDFVSSSEGDVGRLCVGVVSVGRSRRFVGDMARLDAGEEGAE